MALTTTEYRGDDADDWITRMTGGRPAAADDTAADVDQEVAEARAGHAVLARHAHYCVEVALDDAHRRGVTGAAQTREVAAQILTDDTSACLCQRYRDAGSQRSTTT